MHTKAQLHMLTSHALQVAHAATRRGGTALRRCNYYYCYLTFSFHVFLLAPLLFFSFVFSRLYTYIHLAAPP